MEIPPGLNSFRRLVTYRIAQRFGLQHAASDGTNEVTITESTMQVSELIVFNYIDWR